MEEYLNGVPAMNMKDTKMERDLVAKFAAYMESELFELPKP
jgi:hypothetical protein